MKKEDKEERKDEERGEIAGSIIRAGFAIASVFLAAYLIYMVGRYVIQDMENNKVRELYEVNETEMPTLADAAITLNIDTDVDGESMEETESTEEEEKEEVSPISQEDAVAIYLGQPLKQYDHAGLKEMNADYEAWLDIPGTKISYPVVHSKDNTEYLTRSFEGQKRSSGAIFIDANIGDIKRTMNLVIHGHNMKSGSMFATLPAYKDVSYYNLHPFVYLYTDEGPMVYQVISAYIFPDGMDEELVYGNGFRDQEEYKEFVDGVLERSMIDTQAEAVYDKQILTLSTCVNHSSSRFIVHAVRFQ